MGTEEAHVSQPKQANPAAAPAQPDFLNDWALRAEAADDTVKPGG